MDGCWWCMGCDLGVRVCVVAEEAGGWVCGSDEEGGIVIYLPS